MRTLRNPRTLLTLLALLALAAWLGACSDDDDPADPGGGDEDTNAPQVVSTLPADATVDIGTDADVTIVFSEAMDPATAAGAVTMSAGSVAGISWTDGRTLVVSHTTWPTGTEVTVTVGTALTDAAGNALEAAHAFSFFTETPGELLLLGTTPADGAMGVNRDAPIVLQFSDAVDPATVSANVTLTDDPAKTDYDYTVDQVETGTVLLRPLASLPASTEITVQVGAAVATYPPPTTLGTLQEFSFTTGTEVDDTPPTVVGSEPANGDMSVAADQGFFRLTFSEPIDPDSFDQPVRWNFAFLFLLEGIQAEPQFSEGGTVVTVPLPNPLPAGLPMELTFEGWEDLAGNVMTTPYVWSAKVAGATDYVPTSDGQEYVAETEWARGNVGSEIPFEDGYDDYYQRRELQSGTTYRLVNYSSPEFTNPQDWEEYVKAASALRWRGFYEDDSGTPPTLVKEMFDTPLDILPLPIAPGTWTDNTTLTIEEEGEEYQLRATLSGEVMEQGDYEIFESGGEAFIKDCWTVVREIAVEAYIEGDWIPFVTLEETAYYAPAFGEVRVETYEVDHEYDEWEESLTWRFPIDTSAGGGGPRALWRGGDR